MAYLVFSHLQHSTLKFEWNTRGFLDLWHSAFMPTAECHNPFSNELRCVAFRAQFARGIKWLRSQIYSGMPQTAQMF
jgi:hypothetical protein